ncbi:hypothetical protein D3C75_1202210 [compost metagenome]
MTQRRVPFDEQEFIDQMMISVKRELAESQFKITFPEEKVYTQIMYRGVVGYPREVIIDVPVHEWRKENPHVQLLADKIVTEEDYKRYIGEIRGY